MNDFNAALDGDYAEFDESKKILAEIAEELKDEKPLKGSLKKKRSFGSVFHSIIGILVMLIGIAAVLYFIWGPARGEFHSDSTDTLYWAEAAMQGKGLINPDFNYAALMPFGGNILMQIWIPLFGVSMLTHTLGMTSFFVLFTASAYWLLYEMHWSMFWKGTAVGGLLMAVSLSTKLREIFWGHIIYYSLGMLFLMTGLAMVLHIYNLKDKPRTRSTAIQKAVFPLLLLIMFTICCTNSTAAMALFALPIIGALFCERMLDSSGVLLTKKNAYGLFMLIICGIGVMLGIMLGKLIANGVVALYANAYSHFTEMETWHEHLEMLPVEFMKLNGLEVNPEFYLMSTDGIGIIIFLAYIAEIVILPLAALLCYGKIKDTGLRMLIWAHFISTAFILIGYICGMLSYAKWRLSPTIVTGFLLSVGFMRWIYKNSGMKRLGVLLLIPAAFICGKCAVDIAKMPRDSYLENTQYKLGQYLLENDLEYGYATFWNAQAITVQTDSKCKVRNIDIDEYGVLKNTYQGNINWYEDQEGQDDYFLLMDYGEYSTLLSSGSMIAKKPHTELIYQGYYIWVFEKNIF